MKALQRFSENYLQQCKQMSTEEILSFLESFRLLHGQQPETSKLISIKIPESLLDAFRKKCEIHGTRYQTQIKKLMREWLHSL